MTRDKVIEAAKDWASLCFFKTNAKPSSLYEHEHKDVLNACIDLAYSKTKEALVTYAKEREKQFAEHDRMLDSIEAALQQEFKNGV